jgi:branched-chain amino acid aminotransferase
MDLARHLGLTVHEMIFSRDELYIADEVFFTGTAAEITPIREVDNRTIGSGRPGPITHKLQQAFFRVVQGKDDTFKAWLTHIQKAASVGSQVTPRNRSHTRVIS